MDGFSLRKGRRYGTLLVDIENSRPVATLDDRSADSSATWLAAHPGTELICRDRARVRSDGGARGTPGAIQVADRWHLWLYLGDVVSRRREHLPVAARAQDPPTEQAWEPAPPPLPS